MTELDFNLTYEKMIERLEKASRQKRLLAIKTFYNVAESMKYNNLPAENRDKIENASDQEVYKFCKALCSEAINRDFTSYLISGRSGDVGRIVYASLL